MSVALSPGPLAAPADPEGLALLVALALVFVPLLLAALVANPETRRYLRLRYGVSTGGVALAVVVGVGTFLALAALGSVPGGAAGLALPLVGLVAGLTALAFAASHARTLARLRRAGAPSTGLVAVTGFVVAATRRPRRSSSAPRSRGSGRSGRRTATGPTTRAGARGTSPTRGAAGRRFGSTATPGRSGSTQTARSSTCATSDGSNVTRATHPDGSTG